MREDICSIPISEVFEPKDGCPICRMNRILEGHLVDYITGAAMMEPDVRMETNEEGFCPKHYRQMLTRKNRLSVALTLETHLKNMQEAEEFHGKAPNKLQLAWLNKAATGCFVCRKMLWAKERMMKTIFILWQKEPDFRKLYSEQPGFCLEHTEELLRLGQKELGRKLYPQFAAATEEVFRRALDVVQEDVSGYCKMYDYRNAGGDWKNTKNAIERALNLLIGDNEFPLDDSMKG
jgi:hypothetical protein